MADGATTGNGGPLALAATMLQPGIVWACTSEDGALRLVEGGPPPDTAGFRWVHLNLADQRSHRWLERGRLLPPTVRALFLGHDTGQRLASEDGAVALVIQDFERDFDRLATVRIGALRIALGPELVLTGRYHPLHSADVVRRRILDGAAVASPAAALDLVLGSVIDTLASRVGDVAAALLAAEDELLAGSDAADTREVVGLRRLCTRLHRVAGEMRLSLQRLPAEHGLAPAILTGAARAAERLAAIDGEIVAAQAQLRLLRDELDLRAAQRTNQNIYVLSILTALMMPATLVTGFFGMNTGGLPMVASDGGTMIAALVAIIASAGTYIALKLMGLTRR